MAIHSRAVLLLAFLLSLLLAAPALADSSPVIKQTSFPDLPSGLSYFDDSNVVLVTDPSSQTLWRSADAGTTWDKLDVGQGKIFSVLKNPNNNQVAVVIGVKGTHWITTNQGKDWKEWKCDGTPILARPAITFHATDPKRMLYLTAHCDGLTCEERVYYTTDGFDSEPKKLLDGSVSCIWAKSTDRFTTGDSKSDENQILCIVKGSFNPFATNYRLISSTDFFRSEEVEPVMHEGRAVTGIMNIAAVKSYIVAAAKSQGTTELALYVTDDTRTWHRAEFGEHKLEEDAYTILESTNYSMQVDVLTTKPSNPMGVLLTSNSNGTFFTRNLEHTNRNTRGFVDFEKIQNIQGIVMVNTVTNWEEVEQNWIADKKVKTQISFDDGRTFHPLKVDDDHLHLHSVTEQRNMGRIFSSPAPGIVMGVGNTGDYLRSRSEGDLYVSDDAGVTWSRALKDPHLFEFGDQGAILVAVEDGESKKIKYSINHGKDWDHYEMDDDIQPIALTTVPDSTSRKFILTAAKGRGSDRKYYIISISFVDYDLKECGKSDFEDWYARVDDEGKPTCIMGHKQSFRRRKRDSKCFVGQLFKDPVPEMENCKCTDDDYECDYENGFTRRSDGDCKLTGPMKPPEDACRGTDKFKGSSGYRLIPGNTCIKSGGVEKDKPIDRDCDDIKKPVASGKISSKTTKFPGNAFVEYYYLERQDSDTGDDETVIMRTNEREVYITHTQGKEWEQKYKDEEIIAIYPHRYLGGNVYLITPSEKVHYSHDRAHSFHSFTAPDKPNQKGLQILSFHPTEKEWLIWTGLGNCEGSDCETIARVSTKGGDEWTKLLGAVRKCQFVYREDRSGSQKLVLCEQHQDENPSNSLSLLSSDDWFETKKELKRDVINFATMSEFIVVAVRDADQQTLQVDTSIDGRVFADAKFPPNFKVPHQQAYTVLDSSTHAVFLHVTVNNVDGAEYGSIVKSNSNGTSYVLMVNEVNRNKDGYVDFEKMQGLEGVAVINRVANKKEVDEGMSKKLKTYMTHNDGADWALVKRPSSTPKDRKWCSGDIESCSLHLHGYTERKDPRDTFSSASAVGMMIGTGNVGEYLTSKADADTFITRDGGTEWRYAAPGTWMWEYGDQGSIIVLVKEEVPTKEVMYSLDEGVTWLSYQFSAEDMVVTDITTIPSDASRSFLLWGKIDGELTSVNLDFSGLDERSKQCRLDQNASPDDMRSSQDYLAWAPSRPNHEDQCLFGHQALYIRKKTSSDCYNGRDIQKLLRIQKNCTCERHDFECDYNYEKQSDGSCKLVEGLEAADPKEQCKKNPKLKEYYGVTGYRKIPLDTCSGGKEMDYTPMSFPCPGFEEEYQKKHGISGAGLFFAIVIPIAAAAGAGYWVWKNWEGKFGRIRLGDGLGTSSGGALDRDAPWIRYPILVLSGVVALIAAVPMVVGTVWKAISVRLGRRSRDGFGGRAYTSGASFGRSGAAGRYAVVADDEGELLGEDSEEEI
ncbi:glycosyl hydrolase [Neohortaea acidophila]|uniref:Vacuolar protein sorting/targeting protein 10 n=1 Tax=Neohortaea acidophila TaxID=245834 RepID=A0A6A6PN93_9PEZI|nr:glycosyl hydrolase [Neohortaea acidophila]KAF2481104.1 glycosyl hydrolase [Neohortaea acidophila]